MLNNNSFHIHVLDDWGPQKMYSVLPIFFKCGIPPPPTKINPEHIDPKNLAKYRSQSYLESSKLCCGAWVHSSYVNAQIIFCPTPNHQSQ